MAPELAGTRLGPRGLRPWAGGGWGRWAAARGGRGPGALPCLALYFRTPQRWRVRAPGVTQHSAPPRLPPAAPQALPGRARGDAVLRSLPTRSQAHLSRSFHRGGAGRGGDSAGLPPPPPSRLVEIVLEASGARMLERREAVRPQRPLPAGLGRRMSGGDEGRAAATILLLGLGRGDPPLGRQPRRSAFYCCPPTAREGPGLTGAPEYKAGSPWLSARPPAPKSERPAGMGDPEA